MLALPDRAGQRRDFKRIRREGGLLQADPIRDVQSRSRCLVRRHGQGESVGARQRGFAEIWLVLTRPRLSITHFRATVRGMTKALTCESGQGFRNDSMR